MGIDVKGHMSGIDDDSVELVRHEFEEQKENELLSNVLEVNFPITVKRLCVKTWQEALRVN